MPGPEEPEVLHGGVANAGAVVRVANHVLRPSSAHSESIHALLRQVRAAGFEGASLPIGFEPDGRERLVFIPGDVPIVPFPAWARSDEALASIARLLRRFHDATALLAFGFTGSSAAGWSTEMADPYIASDDAAPAALATGGEIVICHNDVCPENVVFRGGEAIALLDFDFAAPGRRMFDLAAFARMCVPIDDDSCARFGWDLGAAGADRVPVIAARLRLVADEYGATAAQRHDLFDCLAGSIARGGEFLARRIAAGDRNFTAMWNEGGGMTRFDRRREWFAIAADQLRGALA